MTTNSKACPSCETPMTVMASMPSIQRQESWNFFLCPQCGKVERERFERPTNAEEGNAEEDDAQSRA